MTISLDESYAWCQALSRRTAGNFYPSFLSLPADRYRDMCAIYAFMRVSDDLGDDADMPIARRSELLSDWRTSLQRALSEDCYEHPAFPALASVVCRYEIPQEYLFAVIAGVEADLEPTGFDTFDDLAHYCYRVAGVVGLCCIHIWGFHGDEAKERAVDCGTAFQLTNILRDLGEDAQMGRVYLPREDLERFGYTADDIVGQRRNERFDRLMRFEVERARGYYRRAAQLFENLEPPGRPIYAAMLQTYGGLLDEIERRRYDVYTRRIALPKWRKFSILLNAVVRHRFLKQGANHGPASEAKP